jgi:SH3-like domain-containing protein
MLSGRRTVLVTGGVRALLREPRPGSSTVARAEAGVQGQLSKCRANWCEIDLDGHRGWMPSDHLWGVYAERGAD